MRAELLGPRGVRSCLLARKLLLLLFRYLVEQVDSHGLKAGVSFDHDDNISIFF